VARLSERLSAAWQMAQLVHPDRPLQRGFARVTDRAGETITSSERARARGDLTLHFADGQVDATVDGAPAQRQPQPQTRALERKPRRSYIAPQPGLFDRPEQE
jgi:exodeoxyribonuclease VII large subunit